MPGFYDFCTSALKRSGDYFVSSLNHSVYSSPHTLFQRFGELVHQIYGDDPKEQEQLKLKTIKEEEEKALKAYRAKQEIAKAQKKVSSPKQGPVPAPPLESKSSSELPRATTQSETASMPGDVKSTSQGDTKSSSPGDSKSPRQQISAAVRESDVTFTALATRRSKWTRVFNPTHLFPLVTGGARVIVHWIFDGMPCRTKKVNLKLNKGYGPVSNPFSLVIKSVTTLTVGLADAGVFCLDQFVGPVLNYPLDKRCGYDCCCPACKNSDLFKSSREFDVIVIQNLPSAPQKIADEKKPAEIKTVFVRTKSMAVMRVKSDDAVKLGLEFARHKRRGHKRVHAMTRRVSAGDLAEPAAVVAVVSTDLAKPEAMIEAKQNKETSGNKKQKDLSKMSREESTSALKVSQEKINRRLAGLSQVSTPEASQRHLKTQESAGAAPSAPSTPVAEDSEVRLERERVLGSPLKMRDSNAAPSSPATPDAAAGKVGSKNSGASQSGSHDNSPMGSPASKYRVLKAARLRQKSRTSAFFAFPPAEGVAGAASISNGGAGAAAPTSTKNRRTSLTFTQPSKSRAQSVIGSHLQHPIAASPASAADAVVIDVLPGVVAEHPQTPQAHPGAPSRKGSVSSA